jgi:hypothetical protein
MEGAKRVQAKGPLVRSPSQSCLDTALAELSKQSHLFSESCQVHNYSTGFYAYPPEGGEIHLVFAQHQILVGLKK